MQHEEQFLLTPEEVRDLLRVSPRRYKKLTEAGAFPIIEWVRAAAASADQTSSAISTSRR